MATQEDFVKLQKMVEELKLEMEALRSEKQAMATQMGKMKAEKDEMTVIIENIQKEVGKDKEDTSAGGGIERL